MAINFKAIAENELTLSHLMNGRQQLKTEDVIGRSLTINAFDMVCATIKGEEKNFCVVTFSELPDNYYNGGALLYKMCSAWAAACGGDIEVASEALRKSGGVQVKFSETKTKSGNNLTSIEII